MSGWTVTRPADERNAWCLWLAVFAVLSVGIAWGGERSVAPHYLHAAEHWIRGEPLYSGVGVGFLYLPQAAILYIPFSFLLRIPGEILWRLMTIGTYVWGVRRLCGLSERDHPVLLFPLVTLVVVPLAFSVARNGQSTLLITGLILLAIDDLVNRRWSRSTALLCLAFAVKPTALPFLLVIGALHRPMLWRLLVGLLLVAAAPYLVQDRQYVTEQYVACIASMRTTAEIGIATPWSQLFGLLEIVGITVSHSLQTMARCLAALGTLALAWLAQRRLSPNRYGIYLFWLTAVYVLLFNPRTENNGYALLSPAIGLECAEAFLVDKNRRLGVLLTLIAIGMLGGYEISMLVAPNVPPVWLTPLMAICFAAVAGVAFRREVIAARRASLKDRSSLAVGVDG
ncbi:MAG: DUF2029 domain-containing protein [Planctomycetaceae bacterium]|nr:DUF2029 domain-containing protein [Planctomycetaceae bacterium]